METGPFLPLSPKEFHILLALAEEPRNGYQVAQHVEENSRGSVRLSPATQYTNLHRLAEKGLIHEVELDDRTDGRKQRYWSVTSLGAKVLRDEARRLAADVSLVAALGPED